MAYLQERWQAGCHTTRSLYEEIVQQGYRGSIQRLSCRLQPWRAACPPPPPKEPKPAPRKNDLPKRQLTWKEVRAALLRPPEHLSDAQRSLLQDFLALHTVLSIAYDLVQRFHRILREKDTAAFDIWLRDAAQSKIVPLGRLARTLDSDRAAVVAGIELPWSTGPVEGHINRVKLVKRIGYGRAGLPLLRARVLGHV